MTRAVSKRNQKRTPHGKDPKTSMRTHPKRVAIHILDDCTLNRNKVLGILDFLRKRPQWDIPMRGITPYMSLEEIREWNGDAVIGNFYDPSVVKELRSRGMIVVNTGSSIDESYDIHTVCVDSHKIAILAAEHLLKRKFKSFAFVGFQQENLKPVHFQQRERSFAEAVMSRGLAYQSYWFQYKSSTNEVLSGGPWRNFIQKLKRPVGIFAAADHGAFGVSRACRELGYVIPDEVAVIGVDDDQMLCQIAVPRITSIDPRAEVVGYKAAELLQDIFDGKTVEAQRQLVPPGEIRQRASTDIIATSNLEVAEAIRFINAHAGENINVNDVLRVVSLSRRSLERHFRDATGVGIYEAIRNAHVALASQYLKERNQTLDDVARRSGFSNAQRLNEAFYAVLGISASEFRARTVG